jgi:hypothetical protein
MLDYLCGWRKADFFEIHAGDQYIERSSASGEWRF